MSGRTGASSDYSSLTDSQFLLGSQFWPESSQALSQDVSFSSRSTKQNSEEVELVVCPIKLYSTFIDTERYFIIN